VLGNAAGFFTVADPRIAEDLLRKAQALDPGNPKWSERLGHLHSLDALVATSQVKREAAVKCERRFGTPPVAGVQRPPVADGQRVAFEWRSG
jgi:hypothetical protein